MDCHSFADEIAQHGWKSRQGVVHAVAASSARCVTATSRVADEVNLSADAAKEVGKQSVRVQNKPLIVGTHVSSAELITWLEDCVDVHSAARWLT